MRRLALLALVAGCAGIEGDIDRTEMKEFFVNFVKGKDRGLNAYRRTIEKSVTKVQGRRYQYVAPAHISNWYVDRSVRGLGGTDLPNSDYLASAVDKLLFVLSYDPTAAIRSTTCEQLGRILLKLPYAEVPLPVDGNADIRINQIADDLAEMATHAREGKKVPVSAVVERLHALEKERPRTLLGARQVVRVLAAAPVSQAISGPIRDTAQEVGPALIRDAILVSLREVAVGLPDIEPDDAPLVRQCAVEVLTRVGSPVARAGAEARLMGGIDPFERDTDVRRALLAYLGTIGGPGAFNACVERLLDLDVGVRFSAQMALQEITGARADPTPEAWRAWAEQAKAGE